MDGRIGRARAVGGRIMDSTLDQLTELERRQPYSTSEINKAAHIMYARIARARKETEAGIEEEDYERE